MQRTIENCTLIQKNTKAGIEKPQQWHYLDKCEGYRVRKKEDELCEQCKKCRYCIRGC